MTLQEAHDIVADYTRSQILALAQRAYDEPASISPHEMDVVVAFVRCSAAKESQN
jgi:hypothetical protein